MLLVQQYGLHSLQASQREGLNNIQDGLQASQREGLNNIQDGLQASQRDGQQALQVSLQNFIEGSVRNAFARQHRTIGEIHHHVSTGAVVFGTYGSNLPSCNGARACPNCTLLSLAAHCFSYDSLSWRTACKLWRRDRHHLYAPWSTSDVFCVIPVFIDAFTDFALGYPILRSDLLACPDRSLFADPLHNPYPGPGLAIVASEHVDDLKNTSLQTAYESKPKPEGLILRARTYHSCISTSLVTNALLEFAQSPTCDDAVFLPGAVDGKLHTSIGGQSFSAINSAFVPTRQDTIRVPQRSRPGAQHPGLHLLMPTKQLANGSRAQHKSGARRWVEGIMYDLHAEGVAVPIPSFNGSSGAIGYIFREARNVSAVAAEGSALCAEQKFVLSAGIDHMSGITVFSVLRSPSVQREQAAACAAYMMPLNGTEIKLRDHCDISIDGGVKPVAVVLKFSFN